MKKRDSLDNAVRVLQRALSRLADETGAEITVDIRFTPRPKQEPTKPDQPEDAAK